jgi:Tfp pilus assembly protein PilX
MNMKNRNRQHQSGGVSIFVVVFSALLVTIVTVSFVSVMLRTQQQASNADLSNSAYDAALAGVEDAKRLLLIYRQCQRTGDTSSTPCQHANAALSPAPGGAGGQLCNTNKKGLYGLTDFNEVLVQRSQIPGQDNTSVDLDQAYTCVTIDFTSPDLKGSLADGESRLIPIETDGGVAFNKIKISWFKKAQDSTDALNLPLSTTLPKHTSDDWPAARPPVMRTQLIQVGNTFSADQFDQDGGSNQSNTNTLFLYPSSAGLSSASYPPFTTDNRTGVNAPKSPYATRCSPANYVGNDYACQTTIDMPEPIGGARKNFYLQLSALYNAADFKIELLSGATAVEVVGPVVDSTGRANDLFRRVQARIDFAGEYAKAAIDIEGNLCKDFSVTDKDTDFIQNSCTPRAPTP